MTMTGGCLCGAVRYAVASGASDVFLCYCRQCQRSQGAAFVASVPVPVANFRITRGAGTLKAYRASPAKARYFCVRCGSPIYSRVDAGATVRIRAGTLDDPSQLRIKAHIHTAEKTAWYDIADPAPQYPAQEPGR